MQLLERDATLKPSRWAVEEQRPHCGSKGDGQSDKHLRGLSLNWSQCKVPVQGWRAREDVSRWYSGNSGNMLDVVLN